jgi:hypothetical protein
MIVNNDINQYNELKKLSVLDYYAFVEMVNSNIQKMHADGQGKDFKS